MRNRGLRRPGRSALICAAVAAGGAISVWSGVADMDAFDLETAVMDGRIGLGFIAASLGTLFFFNFFWAMRVVGALRSGRGVIERWTVDPATFDRFREADRQLGRTERGNDYRLPKKTPRQGVEVIFSADGVLIGDTFFGLASTGVSRFNHVAYRPLDPPVLEFGTVTSRLVNTTQVKLIHDRGVLRVPVAPEALIEAFRVRRHFEDVIARRVIVKPHFWRLRIRIGMGVALLSFVAAGVGFALREQNSELQNIPLVLAVAGTVLGLAGLVLAFLAWSFRQKQHRA